MDSLESETPGEPEGSEPIDLERALSGKNQYVILIQREKKPLTFPFGPKFACQEDAVYESHPVSTTVTPRTRWEGLVCSMFYM